MKILVTGGAGFIGSNLCSFLVIKGHELVIVDDLSTGKRSNLSSIIQDIDFYESKTEKFDFSKCSKIEVVVHLAAQASVPLSISRFKESSTSNLLSTFNVIDFCNSHNIPLVYASSSAIYGELDIGDDSIGKLDVLSPYAVDKYAMELYATVANAIYKLPNLGLRFFNVYGPRQDPNSPYSGVISIFVNRLLRKEAIIINGGHQTRDFIYINDVVKCIYQSIKLVLSSDVCEQINVLTGRATSIDQLATMLAEKVGYTPEKIYKSLQQGDPEKSDGTIDKMTKLLDVDVANMVSIHEGLDKTIDFLKSENHEQ